MNGGWDRARKKLEGMKGHDTGRREERVEGDTTEDQNSEENHVEL